MSFIDPIRLFTTSSPSLPKNQPNSSTSPPNKPLAYFSSSLYSSNSVCSFKILSNRHLNSSSTPNSTKFKGLTSAVAQLLFHITMSLLTLKTVNRGKMLGRIPRYSTQRLHVSNPIWSAFDIQRYGLERFGYRLCFIEKETSCLRGVCAD